MVLLCINNNRKVSILEIRRVNPSIDTGYYECHARNVLRPEPVIARVRVIVTRPPPTPKPDTSSTQSTASNGHPHQQPPPKVQQSIGPLPTPPSSGYWPIRGSKDGGKPLVGTSNWAIRSCPIRDFCLNGGSCSFYESVGEYVCQ